MSKRAHTNTTSRQAAARRAAARRRGRLRLAGLLALVGIVIGFVVSSGGGSPAGQTGQRASTLGTTKDPSGPPAIEAGLEPWKLNGPLSREVVLPARDGHSLVVAGGLQPSGSSTGVYRVDPINGSAVSIGQLQAPLHDSAGVVLDGKGYLFGGGAASPSTEAERLSSLQAGSGQAVGLAQLPQARADDAAVVLGKTAYIIGGYSGPTGDSAVLATRDGRHYKVVAHLPVPVRYPAVARLGGEIAVFGGDATSGSRSGAPLSTIQLVNPKTGSAKVVGSLPEPLAGAAAVNLGGTVYLAGGETVPKAASASSTPSEVSTIWAYPKAGGRLLVAGHLMVGLSHAGVAVIGKRAWLVGGETKGGVISSDVQMFEPNRAFGTAGLKGAGSPYFGDTLLIADRGANRLLALSDTGRIIWRYPTARRPGPKTGFYFPDDAFFIRHGRAIISNQEANETLVEIAYPSGKVIWTYGHPHQPGSLPGYLNNPDDAYLLKNGRVVVADPKNCRVLVLDPKTKKVLTQIGTPGACYHNPPHYLGSPNGDTPLANGNLLVSEINGSFIDEFTQSGKILWSTHLPIGYPSDPQPLSGNRYLVANYENPGAFIIFKRSGKILYRYSPSSGTGELNQPSLVEMLPSGVLMSNDDYNDRMVAVDPATNALVWQYGRTGVPGTAPGLLDIPDGFDLLGPKGSYPTHPPTG
jgi:hypothetical protein